MATRRALPFVSEHDFRARNPCSPRSDDYDDVNNNNDDDDDEGVDDEDVDDDEDVVDGGRGVKRR